MTELPIDIIPGTKPPKFKWTRTVDTPLGAKTTHFEDRVQPNIELKLIQLIQLVKKLQSQSESHLKEIEKLKEQLVHAAKRIADQSELLSKKAEKPEVVEPTKTKRSK